MSKKLKNLKWESVALEGFPITTNNFDGFVGLEECSSYGLDKESKRPKKNKPEQKRKFPSESETQKVPNKKLKPNQKHQEVKAKKPKQIKTEKPVKLANGFIVETISNSTNPSQDNKVQSKTPEIVEPQAQRSKRNERKKKMKEKIQQIKEQKVKTQSSSKPVKIQSKAEKKIKKPKLGEQISEKSDLTPEDMLTWAEFKLPEPILKALMELGFKKPTKIQQLTLPAAIHGRRDLLGAAETGSGKTLAFGLPILSGILQLKEKADAKGLDVYEIPYKKGPSKPKKTEKPKIASKKIKKNNIKEVKESSEDGYGSGDEDEEIEKEKPEVKKKKLDYLEEYEVPLKKKDTNTPDYDESDDENYVHLSDLLDSEDLSDKSDEETESVDEEKEEQETSEDDDAKSENDEEQSDNDNLLSEDEDDQSDDKEELSEDEILGGDNEDESGLDEMGSEEDIEDSGNPDETGIGCVKVVDNIEIPGHVVTKTGKPLYALIMTPTRELAIQISRHLIAVAKYTGIKVATIVGGMAHVKQERVLRSGPEIVVATPGRLWELINQGQPHLQQLDTVKFLAIDETDRMIERGHFEELTPLLERLNADEDRRAARQNFVFSATLTLVHDLPTHMKGKKVTKHGKIINRKIKKMTPEQKVKRLVDLLGMTEPKVVDITQTNLGTAESLTECKITCAMEHKDAYLYYILKRHPGRTIVFCNSIGSVKRLATLLTVLKCHPLPLHASMAQRQRLKNLERFRDDPHGVLIATDVAARGLDIPLVDHVVQYQCPRTAENYVHRSGRTARAEREGLNVLMVEPAEAYNYSKLCLTLNKTSEVPTFPVASHLLAPLKDMVALAREMESLEQRKRRNAQARGWREKAAAEMDIIIDDDDVPTAQADPTIDKALKARRRQLDVMLSRPIFPRGFSFKYPTLNDPMALSMPQEKALEVMKKAIETGELKKEKRKSKNAPLLKLSRGVHKNKKLKNKS